MTEDSGLICTGAATSFFQLALYLIEYFGSEELARSCAKALLVDPNRESQAPYAMLDLPRDHGDAGVLQAQHVMENRYPETLVMMTRLRGRWASARVISSGGLSRPLAIRP